MINIIDLFAGAGGLSEGFREYPFNTVCHIEMDYAACDTLKTREAFHYLKNKNMLSFYDSYLKGEIDKKSLYSLIPKTNMDKIIQCQISDDSIDTIFSKIDDLKNNDKISGIIGGPPCQAFSTIGRAQNESKKAEDKRIYLYTHYVRFLDRYKPDFFLFENVKGLLSYKDEFDELLLPKILNAFKLCGYKVDLKVINSDDFGVPQRRQRVFIFGHRFENIKFELLDEIEKFKELPITIRNLFSDLPKLSISDESHEYANNNIDIPFMKYIRENSTQLTLHSTRYQNDNDLNIYRIVAINRSNGLLTKYSDLPSNLIKHKNSTVFLDRFKAIDYDSISHTVVAHISKDGHYYIHPDASQNRSISIREAARIQSFQDNYYFEGNRAQKLTQIGNAVPPYLSRVFANVIKTKYKTDKI